MTIVLVTGGNRGIGFGIIQALSIRHPEYTLLMGCRHPSDGEAAIQKLRSLGTRSTLVPVEIDIDDNESVTKAANTIDSQYGRLDGMHILLGSRHISLTLWTVLINNAAGFQFPKSQKLEDIRRNSNEVFNNCVSSNIVVSHALTPLLRKGRMPRVIFTSSARGSLQRTALRQLPPARITNYCISKAALNMLMLHLQQAEDGTESNENRITYWCVSPGHTRTGFNNFQGKKDPLDSAEVFVRLLDPENDRLHSGTIWEFEEGVLQEVPW